MDEATGAKKVGYFGDLLPTADPDTARTIMNITGEESALTTLTKFDTTEEFQANPMAILMTGGNVKDIGADDVSELQAVLETNCIVVDNASFAERKCLEGLLNLDSNPETDLTAEELQFCADIEDYNVNSNWDNPDASAAIYCPDAPPRILADETIGETSTPTSISGSSVALTGDECLKWKYINDVVEGEAADLTLVDTSTCDSSTYCNSQVLNTLVVSNSNVALNTSSPGFNIASTLMPYTQGDPLLEISPSLSIYRTTSVQSAAGAELCSDTYCDVYIFTLGTNILTEQRSVFDNDRTKSKLVVNDSPTWPDAYEQLDSCTAALCNEGKGWATGSYFNYLNLYAMPSGEGFIKGDIMPLTDGSQIYTENNSSTDSETWTVGGTASVGVKGETPEASLSVNASYTAGTTESQSSTTTTNALTLYGNQSFETNAGSVCPSGTCISNYLGLNATSFSDDDIETNYSKVILETPETYPTFTSSVTPDTIHVKNYSTESMFMVIRPKSAIPSDSQTEQLKLNYDLGYQFIYGYFDPFAWICDSAMWAKVFPWNVKDTEWGHSVNFQAQGKIAEDAVDDIMTDISVYRTQSCSSTADAVLADLKTTPGNSACTDDSVVEDIFHPGFAKMAWSTPTTNNNGSIDSDAECAFVCKMYPDTDNPCYWSRWSEARGCEISTTTTAVVDLTRENASCTDNTVGIDTQEGSTFSYHFNLVGSSSFPFSVSTDSQDTACVTD